MKYHIINLIALIILCILLVFAMNDSVESPTVPATTNPVTFNIPLPESAYMGDVAPNSVYTTTSVEMYR